MGKGYTAPSDKLNLAAIGSGGKGYGDIKNSYDNGTNNVVALCDVDSKAAGRARTLFPKAKYFKVITKISAQIIKDKIPIIASG